MWDNNDLHKVKGRSTDLLQRYKSLPFVSAKDEQDLTQWYNQIPTEWYNAFVLVLLGLGALAITRIMIWYAVRRRRCCSYERRLFQERTSFCRRRFYLCLINCDRSG